MAERSGARYGIMSLATTKTNPSPTTGSGTRGEKASGSVGEGGTLLSDTEALGREGVG